MSYGKCGYVIGNGITGIAWGLMAEYRNILVPFKPQVSNSETQEIGAFLADCVI